MSQSKVKVTANEEGQVVVPSSKEGFAYIRVEQEKMSMERGFLNNTTRSAIIGGRKEELEALNLSEGDTFPGKIYVEERLEPFYEGQEPKINPETAEVLKKDGQPIYRQSFYTEDLSKTDTFISHNTVGEREQQEEGVEEEMSITQ